MSSMQIQQVLAEMRALQARAVRRRGRNSAPSASAQPSDFASLLKGSVDHIATMQNQATALADAYEAGDKSVDLTKVMLEVQKAGLAFRAMTEVRNKLRRCLYPGHEHVGVTTEVEPWLTSYPRRNGASSRPFPRSSRSACWPASPPRSPPRSGWCCGRRARTTPCSTGSCPSARAAR